MNTLKPLRSILVFLSTLLALLSGSAEHAAAQAEPSLPGQFAYVENSTRLFLVRGNVGEAVLLLQADNDKSIASPGFSRAGRYLAVSTQVPPQASPAPSPAARPLPGQESTTSDRVAMFSILLWAGALIAITILMFYLWRYGSAPAKQEKTAVAELPVEEKAAPAEESAPKPSREEADKYFREGVDLVRAGKASEGIAELSKVIGAEPGNNVAWFWLGIASARQKDYRSAERCFLQAKRFGHPEAGRALDWLRKQKG